MTTARQTAPQDPYEALAEVYDAWQDRYGAFWKLVLPRLERTFIRLGLPSAPGSFLDLGCGTGGLLIGLRERHPSWTLCGIDASAGMLRAARRKRGAQTIRYVEGAFAADVGAASFVAAGAYFDALNHAFEPGAFEDALAAAARALRPGGLFVFDLNNRAGFEAWWRGRRVYGGHGWTMTMDALFDSTTSLAHGRAVVHRRGPGGGHGVTEVTERCFTDGEVRAALAAAGFSVEEAELWRPLHDDVPGKTWWAARKL